ncbi:hypothetical protein [Pandoraea sp. NPDC090278]|uniref:hypothetical protein n=1 Tax=Pandoraea sp. NPDC090278 TaxID=3364391 RepID=UPI00383A4217
MLTIINFAANAVIFSLSLWAVLTHRVPTKSAGAVVLFLVNSAALGNMGSTTACHSAPEVMLNAAIALAALWAFWHVQIKRHVLKGFSHDTN